MDGRLIAESVSIHLKLIHGQIAAGSSLSMGDPEAFPAVGPSFMSPLNQNERKHDTDFVQRGAEQEKGIVEKTRK